MVEFWEGVIQILMILIPTSVAAVSSKLIVNSWQEKKEEFNLKKDQYQLRKQIIDDFEKSYVAEMVLISNFVDKVIHSYTTDYRIGLDDDEIVEFAWKLPDDEKELPIKKFVKEYEEFRTEDGKLIKEIWNFFSTVRVYYSLNDISNHMQKISDASKHYRQLAHALIYSKNNEVMHKVHDKLDKYLVEFRTANHEVSNMLANTKMHKSPDQLS